MRVAYLTEWPPYGETGVLRKIISQTESLRKLGCEISIFAVATLRPEQPSIGFERFGSVYGQITQRYVDAYPHARLGYLNKVLTIPKLRAALLRFAPDIIYYRQNGPWYPGLRFLLETAPTVLEVNGDEDIEAAYWGRAAVLFRAATRGRIERHVSGFVCVTGELAEKVRAFEKPIAIIPNGFSGRMVGVLEPSGNIEPAFVFIGSVAGEATEWYGVDKFFLLASHIPKSKFHVIGYKRSDFSIESVAPNVVFHGHQDATGIARIYRNCDVGISSLSLFLKGQHDACLLKTREYLMFGLPVVLAYREAEERLNHAPYVLSIGNYPDNVLDNLNQIHAFAKAWTGKRVKDDLEFLSSDSKERERLEFFHSIREEFSAKR